MRRGRHIVELTLVCLHLLAGCAAVAPGIRVSTEPTPLDADPLCCGPEGLNSAFDAEAFAPVLYEISPELIQRLAHQRQSRMPPNPTTSRRELGTRYTYTIGPGDVLSVVVWNHPELNNPEGVSAGTEPRGTVVRHDGTFFYPFAGRIQAAGRTVEDVRQDIAEGLRTYIEDPQVDVSIVEFRSQKVYVTGEVNEPGVLYLDDRPLTVLDALSRSGHFGAIADRRFAHLTREGLTRVVDLHAVYTTGGEDLVLQDGDVLHVPDDTYNRVIVMGETAGRQASVSMARNRLSLAEALNAAEVQGLQLTTADTRRIVVIRGEPVHDESGEVYGVRPLIYQLDASQASALFLAEGFQLQPRDIVFVPAAPIVRWTRVMNQILPIVGTVWLTERLVTTATGIP
jgi:polysaccharide biosynthesis/export protein